PRRLREHAASHPRRRVLEAPLERSGTARATPRRIVIACGRGAGPGRPRHRRHEELFPGPAGNRVQVLLRADLVARHPPVLNRRLVERRTIARIRAELSVPDETDAMRLVLVIPQELELELGLPLRKPRLE